MSVKEKARANGPIPTAVVYHDSPESKATALDLQVMSAFDYAALAPDDAADLRQQAARLRNLITKSTADMIRIGFDLTTIKERLDHGQFTSWVEREIGISARTAQNYIAMSKLAEGKNEIVSLFPPSTVRILAAKSAPPEIVEQVIADRSAGNIISDHAVKDLIAERRAELRQQERVRLEAERDQRRPRSVREKRERERQEYQAEREREIAANKAAAQAILDRLAPDDLSFVLEKLSFEVLEELHRLAGLRGAA